MSNIPIIRIDNLSRSYPNSAENILNNLSLELHRGSFCFVVGKSGVGKTTLTKFIIRELRPPLGTIFHNRDDIARYSLSEIQAYRKKIGIIFQDCKLLERKTIEENILYPLMIDGENDAIQQEKLAAILATVGLQGKEQVRPSQLSGGEKQRAAIARALIRNPEFIIADEPTGNIDQAAGETIADKFIEINKQGTTILFITHDGGLIDYVKKRHPVTIIEIT